MVKLFYKNTLSFFVILPIMFLFLVQMYSSNPLVKTLYLVKINTLKTGGVYDNWLFFSSLFFFVF